MISVIIPALDEAGNLRPLLRALGAEPAPHEVIVADGGSGDDTVTAARVLGARVIECERGRGRQLRAGARAARGEALLFLHADCDFPAGGLARIEVALGASPGLVGGNFRLVFDGTSSFSRRLTAFYAWLRRRGLYYGDSGIFVRRQVYQRLGGIRAIALMEDYDFVRRLERLGPTCCIDEPPLKTSSRRFEGRHGLAIVSGWLVIHALYHLGVSPTRLAGLYRSERH